MYISPVMSVHDIYDIIPTDSTNTQTQPCVCPFWPLDDFFYCPHHPDSGFPNEVREFKISCKCRKPEAGLIEKASAIYPIDIEKSWMIGDSWRDIELARRLGLRSIQIGE